MVELQQHVIHFLCQHKPLHFGVDVRVIKGGQNVDIDWKMSFVCICLVNLVSLLSHSLELLQCLWR